ncbi:MAG: IS630 family transposase [Planctomycetes bacterium]|nr:IS630 family transposase [Planctomycetota bacterium]
MFSRSLPMEWSMVAIMTERDARSLDHATLEEMRRLGVSRVLAGESQVAVAASLQVNLHTVSKWMRKYRAGGADALTSTKAPGPPRTLSDSQLAKLRRIVIGKNPRQLHFGPALWTLSLVGELIEQLFSVVHHASTISRLLHGMGITPQVPTKRSTRRDEQEIQHWIRSEFPKIVRERDRLQATLLFSDETGVHEDGPVGRTWGERGKTPLVKISGTRRRVNVISALSPRGRLWFRCYGGTLTATRFVEFLQSLLDDTSKPIVLVIDRHPAHVAACTRRFIQANRRRLRVHYLPGYAPELNPDEHVWSYLKGAFRRDPLDADERIEEVVGQEMSKLQSNPRTVKSFFDHPEVRYVKAALGW